MATDKVYNNDPQIPEEEKEKLKLRYPVQQAVPDETDDTTNVEDLEEYTTELDRGEDTRERG